MEAMTVKLLDKHQAPFLPRTAFGGASARRKSEWLEGLESLRADLMQLHCGVL